MDNTLQQPAGFYRKRITSIDVARGIIMVIMALDHVRDFFHKNAQLFSPTDLDKTSIPLFFTRWITHFCAPTFVLLAGTSIAMSGNRKTKKELSFFLLTRGFWLIVLDVTVMRFVFFFNFYYDITFLNVLWMIGLCMMFMAGVIHLSDRWILIAGLLILFLFNAFDSFSMQPGQLLYAPWLIFMRVGFIPLDESHAFITSYSIVPWLSVMMLGYSLGFLYQPSFDSEKRKILLTLIGCGALILFILLRTLNIYGDAAPWSDQSREWFTLLSFINVTKYPVSLQFILMTGGFLMLLLRLLENGYEKMMTPFRIVGRVPLFYFVGHFFLAHLVALLVITWQNGKSFSEIDFHFSKSFGGIVAGTGVSLTWVYVAWVIIVLLMYPACKIYDQYKNTHSYKWLRYL